MPHTDNRPRLTYGELNLAERALLDYISTHDIITLDFNDDLRYHFLRNNAIKLTGEHTRIISNAECHAAIIRFRDVGLLRTLQASAWITNYQPVGKEVRRLVATNPDVTVRLPIPDPLTVLVLAIIIIGAPIVGLVLGIILYLILLGYEAWVTPNYFRRLLRQWRKH